MALALMEISQNVLNHPFLAPKQDRDCDAEDMEGIEAGRVCEASKRLKASSITANARMCLVFEITVPLQAEQGT